MAQKTKTRRLARAFKNTKRKTNMAFGRMRRRFRRFRPFRRFRRFSFRPRRRFRRGGGGYRIPFVPRRLNGILILVAVIGGIWYFGKEHLKPLIDKIFHKAPTA